jgi:hypothetical protein
LTIRKIIIKPKMKILLFLSLTLPRLTSQMAGSGGGLEGA